MQYTGIRNLAPLPNYLRRPKKFTGTESRSYRVHFADNEKQVSGNDTIISENP